MQRVETCNVGLAARRFLRPALGGAGGNGLLGGSSLTDVDSYPNRAGQTGTRAMTIPRDATGGPKEGSGNLKKMASLRARLETKLAASKDLKPLARQVRMVDTTEGVRIDLVDDANFSMFALGTTLLTTQASGLLKAIAATVSPETGGLTIRGHTDALPWRSGGKGSGAANNWSLSAGRAEATRQALLRSGIAEGRFRRIEGVADRELLVRDNPQDPRNRRISIVVM